MNIHISCSDKISFYLHVKQRDYESRSSNVILLVVRLKWDKRANCLPDYFDSFSIQRNIAIDYKWNFGNSLQLSGKVYHCHILLSRKISSTKEKKKKGKNIDFFSLRLSFTNLANWIGWMVSIELFGGGIVLSFCWNSFYLCSQLVRCEGQKLCI